MREISYFLCGMIVFLIVSVGFWIWFLMVPADQIIFLSILALPLDILFFLFAKADWSTGFQTTLIAIFGMIQYGCIGFVIAYLKRKWN